MITTILTDNNMDVKVREYNSNETLDIEKYKINLIQGSKEEDKITKVLELSGSLNPSHIIFYDANGETDIEYIRDKCKGEIKFGNFDDIVHDIFNIEEAVIVVNGISPDVDDIENLIYSMSYCNRFNLTFVLIEDIDD